MVNNMKIFAAAKIEKVIRESGAIRVSSDAIDTLNEIVTDHGTNIAKKAIEIAHQLKRGTIKEVDIKLANVSINQNL